MLQDGSIVYWVIGSSAVVRAAARMLYLDFRSTVKAPEDSRLKSRLADQIEKFISNGGADILTRKP